MFLVDRFDRLNWNSLRIVISLHLVGLFVILALLKEENRCSWRILQASRFQGDLPQGEGCVLRRYSKRGAQTCLRNLEVEEQFIRNKIRREVVFVGGPEMKQIHLQFLQQFSEERSNEDVSVAAESKHNISVALEDGSNVKTPEFPDLALVTKYICQQFPDLTLKNLLSDWKKRSAMVDLTAVVGIFPFGESKTLKMKDLEIFTKNISSLAFELDVVAEMVPLIWIIPSRGIQPHRENTYQHFKRQIQGILKSTHVELWDTNLAPEAFPEATRDQNFEFQVQVLNNLFCNRKQNNSSSICCSAKSEITKRSFIIAIAIFSIIAVCSLWILYFDDGVKRERNVSDISEKELPVLEVKKEAQPINLPIYVTTALKCVFILGYFFICDRTRLFEKESKSFSPWSFFLPVGFVVVTGLLFQTQSTENKWLAREITDEWKGWMQIVILIYHLTGASTRLQIYMHIRILVSSYLFLTGYGNFSYYWRGGELTFRRYCQVMLRMNLLTVVLCIIMKRPYQFYYFVPLVSFWYTTLFILLLLPPWHKAEGCQITTTKDYSIAASKLMIFLAFITMISFFKNVFDALFFVPWWRFLFEFPDHSGYEWWFRWGLDRYSVAYGAVFSLFHHYLIQEQRAEVYVLVGKLVSRNFFCAVFGLGLIASYSLIFTVCSTKPTCNLIHPFIVWVPIIGYILMRNSSEKLRLHHSQVMAGVGKISLELFICQYHILLASDTKGTLVVFPWGHSIFNSTFVTIIFIFLSYEVHRITNNVVNMVLPPNNLKIVTNLILMLIFFSCMKTVF